MRDNVRLGEEHHHSGDESREEQHDGGRHPKRDEYACGYRHKEKPRIDIEDALQPFGKLGRLHAALLGMHQTCHKENNQCYGERRHGSDEHVADVLEQRHLAHRRGQHRGVGEGRNLVAEIGSRDDGARRPAHAVAVRRADTHEGDADGGDGGPRAARHQRHQGADEAGDEEEHRRRDHLHAVVYHCRNHTAQHPAARHGADEEQNQYGAADGAHIVRDGVVDVLPRHLVEYHPHGHRHRRRHEQRRLARPVEGVRAELPDDKHLQRHQHRQRHKGNEPRDIAGSSIVCIGHKRVFS